MAERTQKQKPATRPDDDDEVVDDGTGHDRDAARS